MAEYIAPSTPGAYVTFTASAAITAGQLVGISGSNTVAPTSGESAAWVGVATTDAASGAKVGITSGGVQELTAAAAIAAGALVVSAAAGQVATAAAVAATPTTADGNTGRAIVGVALTAAAAGAKVLVKFDR